MNTKQLSYERRQIKHEKGGKKTRKLARREVEGGRRGIGKKRGGGGKGVLGKREVCHSRSGEGGAGVAWVGGGGVQVLSPEEQIEAP